MVTKSIQQQAGKKKKVKVLNLNKETVKELTGGEGKRVKGGMGGSSVPSRRQSYITPNNTMGASCGGFSTGGIPDSAGCP